MSRSTFKIFLAAAGLFWAAPASARQMEGVDLADTMTVAGTTLTLSGAALRTATIFNVRVWVGGFYAPAPLTTEGQIMSSPGPLRFDFHFLREVGQARSAEAWRWQFAESNQHDYPGLKKDVEVLAAAYGPIRKGTVQTVVLSDGESLILEDGVEKARIAGRDFQQAFLSVFFGPKPPSTAVKNGFLGRAK